MRNSAIAKEKRECVRILHLEDSAADAQLIHILMDDEGLRCDVTVAPNKPRFENALTENQFDLILCDHGIPGYDGFSALRFAREIQPLTPIIMLSGMLDDAQAVESLKGGATDYILKQRLARLVPAIRRALHEAEERDEKKKLEAAFLRAQRMDSIGALAGGIAHDLNNALAPVLMSVELLKNCDDEAVRERFLDVITSSAQRATGMVKQILGFARGHGRSGPVSVSNVVREMAKILRDTFPKSISISVKSGNEGLWQIPGDATELHQVLLNLCVNARDAMPKGGRLSVSAENARLDEAAAADLKTAPGPYVLLSVADTGTGIPPEVLPCIFEPFFTTKMPDKGTGLGLSTVAGIVRQHGGCIDIKTELGHGTEFRIYFRALESTTDDHEISDEEVQLPTGHGELILVIEDEEAVRELTKTTLETYNYRVVTAQDGEQGITRFKEHSREIRVLVTDTDMPYLDGMGAVHAIKQMRPDIPVIIASGSKYDTEQVLRIKREHCFNLGKPFSADQLLLAVGMAIQH
ncbi:MAG TPA: response regulator [Verrucomicrobiae bacterium]|jgi:signal transduction histidine kinase|nr:response regulator [Verrucomicrobiae bacterium]